MIYFSLTADNSSRLTVKYFGKNKAECIEYINEQFNNYILNYQGSIDSIGSFEDKTNREHVVRLVNGHEERFEMHGILDPSHPIIYYPHSAHFEQRPQKYLPVAPLDVVPGVQQGKDFFGLYYIIDIEKLRNQIRTNDYKAKNRPSYTHY